MTIRAATWAYLDTLGSCVISGWGLTDHVSLVTGVRVYPSSVLKAAHWIRRRIRGDLSVYQQPDKPVSVRAGR